MKIARRLNLPTSVILAAERRYSIGVADTSASGVADTSASCVADTSASGVVATSASGVADTSASAENLHLTQIKECEVASRPVAAASPLSKPGQRQPHRSALSVRTSFYADYEANKLKGRSHKLIRGRYNALTQVRYYDLRKDK